MPLPTFLTSDEMNSVVFDATVDAISDSDASFMTEALTSAVQEAAGYMSRYDYVTVLGETGINRDPILLRYIKYMALFHFIILSSANINYEIAYNSYKLAIRWLEKVSDGRAIPVGWPLPAVPENNKLFHVKSLKKRDNNF